MDFKCYLIIISCLVIQINCICVFDQIRWCRTINETAEWMERQYWSQINIGEPFDKPQVLSEPYVIEYIIKHLPSLDWFTIQNLEINFTTENLKQFTHNNHLRIFNIIRSKLHHVKLEDFLYFQHLRELNIIHSQVQTVIPQDTGSIDLGDFSFNWINKLDKNMFKNIKVKLNLERNFIEHIANGAFSETLEILNLDGNKVSYISDEVIRSLKNLRYFSIRWNQLVSLSNMAPLTKLETISVASNKIVAVPDFTSSLHLVRLDLSHNLLRDINIATVIPRNKLRKKVSLANNLIECPEVNELENYNITTPTTLIWFGNPAKCTCMSKIDKFYKTSNISYGECELKIRKMTSIPYCVNEEGFVGNYRQTLREIWKEQIFPCNVWYDVF